jgi:hypothetical protein
MYTMPKAKADFLKRAYLKAKKEDKNARARFATLVLKRFPEYHRYTLDNIYSKLNAKERDELT